jgi:hypothetical protein
MNARRGNHALVDVGIPQDIEPVPCVAHAMLRVGQEPVDDFFIGIGSHVL